eukprot:12433304-Alexandrium_andersonii.AAC.1
MNCPLQTGPFGAERNLSEQSEAVRCKTRPFGRKAAYCTERAQKDTVGQCRRCLLYTSPSPRD